VAGGENDAGLVRAAQLGDDAAVVALVERHRHRLVGLARSVVGDPDARLTEAAAAAAGQWKFEPARNGEGKPVAVLYTVTIAFKLQ